MNSVPGETERPDGHLTVRESVEGERRAAEVIHSERKNGIMAMQMRHRVESKEGERY